MIRHIGQTHGIAPLVPIAAMGVISGRGAGWSNLSMRIRRGNDEKRLSWRSGLLLGVNMEQSRRFEQVRNALDAAG